MAIDMNNDIDEIFQANTPIPTTMKDIRNVYIDCMILTLQRININADALYTFMIIIQLIAYLKLEPIANNERSL